MCLQKLFHGILNRKTENWIPLCESVCKVFAHAQFCWNFVSKFSPELYKPLLKAESLDSVFASKMRRSTSSRLPDVISLWAHKFSFEKNFIFRKLLVKLLAMRQLVKRRAREDFHNNHISRIVLIKKFFIRNNLAHKYKTCTSAAYYERSTFPAHCIIFRYLSVSLTLSLPLCDVFFLLLSFCAFAHSMHIFLHTWWRWSIFTPLASLKQCSAYEYFIVMTQYIKS